MNSHRKRACLRAIFAFVSGTGALLSSVMSLLLASDAIPKLDFDAAQNPGFANARRIEQHETALLELGGSAVLLFGAAFCMVQTGKQGSQSWQEFHR